MLPEKVKNAKITLVLDLDETLVHCSLERIPKPDLTFTVDYHGAEYKVYVKKRPGFLSFLERVAQLFEVVVFTASQKVYADKLLNYLDPEKRYFDFRIFRDSCLNICGNYIKDLSVLGRDLSSTIIVDNSPHVFGYQLDNGIPILGWYEDETDMELLKLLPFLESLIEVGNVRPLIREKYKLYEKINAQIEHVNKIKKKNQ